MNNVQFNYTPPRFAALIIGAMVFAIYQLGWRHTLISDSRYEYPAALPIAILCALVIGYGLAMLGWLIRKTKGQIGETFRPTRGRIIATLALFLVTPLFVISYLPMIVGGIVLFMIGDSPFWGFGLLAGLFLVIYPLAAMIVRHTYQRRALRFGLLSLCFWTVYAGHTLYSGVMIFHL